MWGEPRMRQLRAIVSIGVIAMLALASGCTSKSVNGSSSAPDGVNQAIWDDYCGHGASLTSYLSQEQNGTLTVGEFVSKLNGSENGIQGDAQASSGVVAQQLQALADAIGRVKVSFSEGTAPDFTELVDAAEALPSCK